MTKEKLQIALPPKVRLKKDNISVPQFRKTFRKDAQNKGKPYNILQHQHYKKLHLIMYDIIQKFGKKFEGVFIRTLSETSNIVNVPWALKEVEGGSLNAKTFLTISSQ